MKKTRKRIFGILMAALMVCLPAMQALAQTYSTGQTDPKPVLFPGDTLTDIATAVMLDGEPVELEGEAPAATWTNDSKGKVYGASAAEDGSILLTLEGYVLDVTGGTSAMADETADPVGGHYVPAADEVEDENAPKKDRAYYPAYTDVKIKADEPKEGMEFDKWTVEQEDVILEDELSSETVVTMPEKRVEITANYRPVQTEAQTEAPADPSAEVPVDPSVEVPADPNAEIPADPGVEVPADPNAEIPADPGVEIPMDPSVEIPADPNVEVPADPSAEVPTDPSAEVPTDPSAEVPIDPSVEVPADPNVEVPADPGMEIPLDPSVEIPVDPNAGSTGETEAVVVGDDAGSDPGTSDPDSSIFDSAGDNEAFPITTNDEYNSGPELNSVQNGTLTAVNSGTATVDGTVLALPGEVAAGTTVTVTAQDNTAEAYRFTGWTASTTDEAGAEIPVEITFAEGADPLTASFEMPEINLTLTANYEPIQYNVTVTNEDGTVTAEDGTKLRFAPFAAGAAVTVEAADKTAAGSEFTGWTVSSDDGTVTAETVGLSVDAENPYKATFAMPAANVLLTANYELIQTVPTPVDETTPTPAPNSEPTATPTPEPTATPVYPLTVTYGTATGEGAVENGFPEGTLVTVTASDRTAENLRFSGWTVTSGNTALTDASAQTTTFTMPAAAVTLTADYAQIQTEPTPAPTFNVTVSGGVITAAGTASGSFEAGTAVQLQANAPATGMKFSRWSAKTETGEAVADSAFTAVNEASTTFTVPGSNVTVTAEYLPIEYSITVNDGTADYGKVVAGATVTITADEAPKGMEFDYWKVDSGNTSLKNSSKATTTFTMPSADVTVSANYRLKEYHVTVQNGYADDDTYYMGDEVTIYSNYPASGREFDQWQKVSGKVSFEDASRWKTTFTMPASDVTVSAAYKDGPSPDSNQILDLAAGGEYVTDTTIKFTAAGAGMDNSNPNPGDYRYRPTGYQIGNVTGSWQASPYTTSMSIKARGDYTLKVNYAKDVFDGTNWIPDGTTDTRSVTFRVLTPAEAVKTGDETPIALMAVLAGASCLLFLLLLSVFIRRRSKG